MNPSSVSAVNSYHQIIEIVLSYEYHYPTFRQSILIRINMVFCNLHGVAAYISQLPSFHTFLQVFCCSIHRQVGAPPGVGKRLKRNREEWPGTWFSFGFSWCTK